MAPAIPGQQDAALDSKPPGAAMGPETYADPSAQGQTAAGMTTGASAGPDAPKGMLGPTKMNGGPNRP